LFFKKGGGILHTNLIQVWGNTGTSIPLTLTNQLENFVTNEKSPEMAIMSLHEITIQIVQNPRSLIAENTGKFVEALTTATKRVLRINGNCLTRVISRHGLRGAPDDWCGAVLSLNQLKKNNATQ